MISSISPTRYSRFERISLNGYILTHLAKRRTNIHDNYWNYDWSEKFNIGFQVQFLDGWLHKKLAEKSQIISITFNNYGKHVYKNGCHCCNMLPNFIEEPIHSLYLESIDQFSEYKVVIEWSVTRYNERNERGFTLKCVCVHECIGEFVWYEKRHPADTPAAPTKIWNATLATRYTRQEVMNKTDRWRMIAGPMLNAKMLLAYTAWNPPLPPTRGYRTATSTVLEQHTPTRNMALIQGSPENFRLSSFPFCYAELLIFSFISRSLQRPYHTPKRFYDRNSHQSLFVNLRHRPGHPLEYRGIE